MHLLDPTVRRMTDESLIETMDSCLRLSRIASVSQAFQHVEAWIDGLGDNCAEELDKRNRARAYQAEQITNSKHIRRDSLTAAFFGGIGGVAPDAERREGYRTDQAKPPENCIRLNAAERSHADEVCRGSGTGVQIAPPAP